MLQTKRQKPLMKTILRTLCATMDGEHTETLFNLTELLWQCSLFAIPQRYDFILVICIYESMCFDMCMLQSETFLSQMSAHKAELSFQSVFNLLG